MRHLVVVFGAVCLLAGATAQADEPKFTNLMNKVPTSDEMIEGLITPLGIEFERLPPPPTDADGVVNPDRAVEAVNSSPLATIAIKVQFEFDSAALTLQAQRVLTDLAAALNSPQLRGSRFLIEGHTDAVGSAAYNQTLSERRAEAVKRFLNGRQVAIQNLSTVGKGETELLEPTEARSLANRRVEIGNLGSQSTSQRVGRK